VSRLAAYFHAHRKWIVGAALAAVSSVAGYAWPHDPWIVTIIGTLAVALGVNIVPNRSTGPGPVRTPPTGSG
jgi:Na+/melibiose symporter-like transporter